MKLLKYFKKRKKTHKQTVDTIDLFNWNVPKFVEWVKYSYPERYQSMIQFLKGMNHECCIKCAAFYYMTDNAGGMKPACTMGGEFTETNEYEICKNCPLKDEQKEGQRDGQSKPGD